MRLIVYVILITLALWASLAGVGYAVFYSPLLQHVVLYAVLPLWAVARLVVHARNRARYRLAKEDLLRVLGTEGFRVDDLIENHGLLLAIDRAKPALCHASQGTGKRWGFSYAIFPANRVLSCKAHNDSNEVARDWRRRTRVRTIWLVVRLATGPMLMSFPVLLRERHRSIDFLSSRARAAWQLARNWELLITLVAAGQSIPASASVAELETRGDELRVRSSTDQTAA